MVVAGPNRHRHVAGRGGGTLGARLEQFDRGRLVGLHGDAVQPRIGIGVAGVVEQPHAIRAVLQQGHAGQQQSAALLDASHESLAFRFQITFDDGGREPQPQFGQRVLGRLKVQALLAGGFVLAAQIGRIMERHVDGLDHRLFPHADGIDLRLRIADLQAVLERFEDRRHGLPVALVLFIGGHHQRRLGLFLRSDPERGPVRLAVGIADLGGDFEAVAHEHVGVAGRHAHDLDRSDRGNERPGCEQPRCRGTPVGNPRSRRQWRSPPASARRRTIRPDRGACACSRGSAASAIPSRGPGRKGRARSRSPPAARPLRKTPGRRSC